MGPALQTDGREMLLAKMRGDPYETEWPLPLYEVAPAIPTSVTCKAKCIGSRPAMRCSRNWFRRSSFWTGSATGRLVQPLWLPQRLFHLPQDHGMIALCLPRHDITTLPDETS